MGAETRGAGESEKRDDQSPKLPFAVTPEPGSSNNGHWRQPKQAGKEAMKYQQGYLQDEGKVAVSFREELEEPLNVFTRSRRRQDNDEEYPRYGRRSIDEDLAGWPSSAPLYIRTSSGSRTKHRRPPPTLPPTRSPVSHCPCATPSSAPKVDTGILKMKSHWG
ncbi:hypothetical protein RHSIM_Rhsim13G0007000 [Rhododendron simsii]|uniref:Uncharacterized protein n=1 Tax=Rhododendron simsii TaxID=118357 RepID=A0A834G0M2_RHOSS|nr:hypothetical protein RHSIM_Rhsim13G0007000 [Rhododendron simsii]